MTRPEDRPRPGPAARAAAAAWVARLHGPARSPEVEAGLKRWLAESPEHVAALELLTDVWERSARLRRRPLERLARWEQVGFRLRWSHAALAAAAACAVVLLALPLWRQGETTLSTRTGEQRTVTLDDGTRVHLNTRTHITVAYGRRSRRVELTDGEALFEVSHDAARPFMVDAGGHRITDLGTQFDVRSEAAGTDLAVTLIEGRVTVSGPAPLGARPGSTGLTLLPGQRLRFRAGGTPRIDRPELTHVTAWERGEVAFDNTPLGEAAAEMNRYSQTQLQITDPGVAAIRISGIFRAGDLGSFAQALAAAYPLSVRSGAGAILLGPAHSPSPPP